MARDTYLKKILGPERFNELQSATVLMVGAGGIGCELLKNLMLSGYGTIHIVDLDTITLSNLNRQFLFRQKDIDKSKSITIKKAVESFNFHGTALVSHHGNIMDTDQFPISWWSQFTYIYNALDNLEARRYVNKMALFLKTPVMESGTTGYDGYVQPIFPYKTECFDCQPKATPQTFPVCTIRSTPSKPIHCITWAKEFLFQQLFDEQQQSSQQDQKDLANATDNAEELENLLRETNELVDLRKLLASDGSDGNSSNNKFFFEMVKKIFQIDIKRLLLIDTLWTNRRKPDPLSEDLIGKLASVQESERLGVDDTKVWSPFVNLYVLFEATKKLQNRLKAAENGDTPSFISFDKDDEDTLDFVVTAANLRSHIFHIDILSKFDIKQIAGNIIPAIATTNAIISGFSNLESLNFLRAKNRADASMVFISIKPNKYVTSATLEAPRSQCGSCSVARGTLSYSQEQLNTTTLQEFVGQVESKYPYSSDFSIILGKSKLIYDFDFEDNLEKTLADVGFKDGELVLIQDEDDELENLELYIDTKSVQDTTELLPSVALRPKVVQKAAVENGDAENGKETERGNEKGAQDTGDLIESDKNFETIVIDDDDEIIEEVDTEEPAQKKRRID